VNLDAENGMKNLERVKWSWGSVITNEGDSVDTCATAYEDELVVGDTVADCAIIANIHILNMIDNGGGDGSRQMQD